MSCLWASLSLSVFVTISLYHTHRCTDANLYTSPPFNTYMHTHTHAHSNIHTDISKEKQFLPIVKHSHNTEPSITAGSSHLRHAPLYGSYFSLIDLYYYNVMITIEPLDA